jgi:pimeloyl-ACP methyl ester carboxylesterase
VRVPESLAPTTPSGSEVAAVFVHGIVSSADVWLGPARDEIAGRLAANQSSIVRAVAHIPGVVPYSFDYQSASLRWVTDPAIAPELATAIECLSRATGNQVVVVAHSMGGLAALEAARHDGAASSIGAVVTIGTPYTGSVLLTIAKAVIAGAPVPPEFAPEAIGLREIIAMCGQAAGVNVDACGWLNDLLLEVPDSPAGAALTVGSNQLQTLTTQWPGGIPALQVAGDIVETYGVWGFPRVTIHDGDVAVTRDSAEGGSGTSRVFTCQPGLFFRFWASPCFHNNLLSNSDVVSAAVSFLEQQISSIRLGGVVATDGQVGSLALGVSTEADVDSALGRPDAAEAGTFEVPNTPNYRALGYQCVNTKTSNLIPLVTYPQEEGPYCRTVYFIDAQTNRLGGFETVSNRYETANGTRVGMSSAEASRRERQPVQSGCFGGIDLNPTSARARVYVFAGPAPTGKVADISADSNTDSVGTLFC